jgi:hypothetical protein
MTSTLYYMVRYTSIMYEYEYVTVRYPLL